MHAIDVLLHALRHNFSDVINESALTLCRLPVMEIAELLQPIDVLPWVSPIEIFRVLDLANVRNLASIPRGLEDDIPITRWHLSRRRRHVPRWGKTQR